MLHHIAKALVERDAEEAVAKASFQAARDMKLIGKEDGSGIGRPPQDRLIVAVPGKDSVTVGFEQSLGSQVSSDCEQAFGRGRINGWKM